MHYSCSHVYEFDFSIMIFMTMNLTQYIPAKEDWCPRTDMVMNWSLTIPYDNTRMKYTDYVYFALEIEALDKFEFVGGNGS